MVFFNNFQKRIRNIIKKIENGKASESNIASLCELLDDNKNIIPEAIGALNHILIKGNIKAFNSAISAYNRMAQNQIGDEHYSVDVFVRCMRDRRNDMRENNILKILEILSITTQKYPERMKIAVPELLIALESTTAKSRELSYFILSILSASHHEFFKGRSKEIIRVLNGLNLDERIYAIRLTKKLAEKEQANAAETYDLIEDLCLNHPDSKLRSEAGFAMDKLKEVVKSEPLHSRPMGYSDKREPSEADTPLVNPERGHLIKGRAEISDDLFSELMVPDKKDIIAFLEGLDLKHLIVNT